MIVKAGVPLFSAMPPACSRGIMAIILHHAPFCQKKVEIILVYCYFMFCSFLAANKSTPTAAASLVASDSSYAQAAERTSCYSAGKTALNNKYFSKINAFTSFVEQK